MADWRKLAKSLALADGRIDTKEGEIIKKELLADGRIDRSELEWLLDVRKSGSGSVQAFDQFVFDCLKMVVGMMIADSTITEEERVGFTRLTDQDILIRQSSLHLRGSVPC